MGCAERFELPPVPEGSVPEEGVYNFDRTWSNMGAVSDIALFGDVMYMLTERNGRTAVEAILPFAAEPIPVPPEFGGRYDGLKRPVALASRTFQGIEYLYVADMRGPDPLARSQDCSSPGDCFLELEQDTGETRHLAAHALTPLGGNAEITFRVRLDAFDSGDQVWLMFGTDPGRIGMWLEIRDDGYIRPVRSDGAFPVDSLAFSLSTWHDVRLSYTSTNRRYGIWLDGQPLSSLVPLYHPLDRPFATFSIRFAGSGVRGGFDALSADDGAGGSATTLDFETSAEVEDDWSIGPFFYNDPPPAVYRYLVRQKGGPIQTFSNPSWFSVDGIALDDDLVLYVATQNRDPADATGVLARGQILRFDRTGSAMSPLADPGSGLGFVVGPRGLYFDFADLLVVDETLSKIQKLDTSMPNTGVFQIPSLDNPAATFSAPRDIVSDENRNIYVADTGNNRVLRFTPVGAFADTVYSLTYAPTAEAGAIVAPRAIEADANEVWIADPPAERVVVLKKTAQVGGRIP